MATNFDHIEAQKENIRPLAEGRSAKSLVAAFSATSSDRTDERGRFEDAIAASADLDDPLEPWLQYIHWTQETYPQGNTVESGLLPLLEKCTHEFRDAAHYKDDPRYLKVWIQYAHLSDNPRDIFTYMARRDIGQGLATYYEEFGTFLEAHGRIRQANDIFEMGLQRDARPLERLKRRYKEFCNRSAAHDQSQLPQDSGSPVLPVVRPALGIKDGSSSITSGEPVARPARKMQVFSDPNDSSAKAQSSGWGSLGTAAERSKENKMAAQPWVGQTLKQDSLPAKPIGLAVFRDPGSQTRPSEIPAKTASSGKRPEKTLVALEFLHDEAGDEYCLVEVLARSRGLLGKTYQREGLSYRIPLRDDSPVRVPRSPTMTMHTRAATDEINEMFSKPLVEDSESDEEMASDMDSNPDDTGEQSLAAPASSINRQSGLNDQNDLENPVAPLWEHSQSLSRQSLPRQSLQPLSRQLGLAKETPARQTVPRHSAVATERLARNVVTREPLPRHSFAPSTQTPSRGPLHSYVSTKSRPSTEALKPVIFSTLFNPTDERIRSQILAASSSSLVGYVRFDSAMPQQDILKRAFKTGHKGPLPVLAFPNGDMFCVKSMLGEGGYGSVYLVETEHGAQNALKVEKLQRSPWEYYILKTLETGGASDRLKRSVVRAHRAFSFHDEAYLVLDYLPQGTVLDLVNLVQSQGATVEKVLALFLTIELMRTVEGLHRNGIIHCDIKADNVMLRLEPVDDHQWVRQYNPSGYDGWDHKGIVLIDFGRAINMNVLDPATRFTADWETDDQDCMQMRCGEPWTYEPDYAGMAAVVHLLLFGRPIKVDTSGGVVRLATSLRRVWMEELWTELFNALLNAQGQITDRLLQLRIRLENELEQSCESGTSLRTVLKRVEDEFRLKRR